MSFHLCYMAHQTNGSNSSDLMLDRCVRQILPHFLEFYMIEDIFLKAVLHIRQKPYPKRYKITFVKSQYFKTRDAIACFWPKSNGKASSTVKQLGYKFLITSSGLQVD